MMPVVLKKYGLKRAIADLFEKINKSDRIAATIENWEEFEREESDNLMLYRIVQELTNNSLKHAQAKNIKLECRVNAGIVKIIFCDNGRGFPQQVLEKSEGIGLWNISNRAQAVGAQVAFSNEEFGGARIELMINLTEAAEEKANG